MIKFFKNHKNILAVISERNEGSMKLLKSKVDDKNRSNFLIECGIDSKKVVAADLVHGRDVIIVDNKSLQIVSGADALVTRENIFLSITVADCVPVYFYDKENNIMGLAHAGWRGVVGNIAKNTLDKMMELGAEAEVIEAVLGPGIKRCHFEIQEDVLGKFKRYPQFIRRKRNRIFVDLFGIIKKQLLDFGIKNENIFISPECTFEDEKRFFSYRRDKPKVAEVMMAIIGMRDN
ncbi:MAG: peptidoglycan editing factor PgeF [Candidatus Moranbacteria bacterium]|jgi:YfiH family protein|nr:peptidoglycan editing factor PgeF [Candidatus Moranbacteria bacterium]